MQVLNWREDVQLSLCWWYCAAKTPNNSGNESQAEVGMCADRFINGFPKWCMFAELLDSLWLCALQQNAIFSSDSGVVLEDTVSFYM